MIFLGCCCHSWWNLKEKAQKIKIASWCLWFLKYEMSIACISICVNNIICYHNMWNEKIEHKSFWWFTCTICEFYWTQNRILLGHWDHEYRIAKTAWLLHWEEIVAHFHIYCHEGTRMPKTLSSLQKWLMISLCTSFIHNFYTFWNTHKIKQWWSYFNTIRVVLILECNFIS